MRLRLHPFRALAAAASLTALAAAWPAYAQQADPGDDLGLRTGFDSGFPTSPTNLPATSPESTAAPALAPAGVEPPRTGAELDPITPPSSDDDQTGPNYGKAKKKKPKLYTAGRKLYAPNPDTSPPLPALVPYRGAPGTRRALNPEVPAAPNGADQAQPGPTVAVIPGYRRVRKPLPDPDPFLPTGVQVGQLRLLPFFEGTTGYETNPNQVTSGVKASPVLRAEGGLDVVSDFETHSLTASLRGGYSDFPSNSSANRPDASGLVDSRIDVTRDDQINLEGRFTVSTQTPGSPLLAVPNSVFITDRPSIVTEGATLGGAHTFNRLTLGLKGTFDRTEYGDATQSNGSTFRFSQDNYNDYGVVARASYEVTPAFSPFVEAGADTRVRDNPIDLSGYLRNSVGVLARGGAVVEFSRLLTGTISAGYAERHYADPRLGDLRGPTADAALIYTATPLTTVKLTASTTLSETTLAGSSGAISRAITLEVDHQLFRNFTLSGIATYQPNEYQGIVVNEAYTTLTAKAAYSFTRDVQVFASASRQNLNSTLGDGFKDYIYLTGIRLQR